MGFGKPICTLPSTPVRGKTKSCLGIGKRGKSAPVHSGGRTRANLLKTTKICSDVIFLPCAPGGDPVTDNLFAVAHKFLRPQLVVSRTRETSLRFSHPYASQAVGLLRVTNSLCSFVRSEGIEPPTLWFEARCSNPLSYERIIYIH